MLEIIFFTFFCAGFSQSIPNIFDFSLTKTITLNDTNSYFGYSILLQRGNPPIAIIGAPRKKHGRANTGSVYKCNLNNLRCEEYSEITTVKGLYIDGKNGYFLGSDIDGDDTVGGNFFTCAPRFTEAFSRTDYYAFGRCFHIRNSLNTKESPRLIQPLSKVRPVSVIRTTAYYDAAFGESGFDIVYSKNLSELIIGAPGKSLWNGALVRARITTYNSDVFSQQPDLVNYHDNYFGYGVEWGRFLKNSQKVWYVSGAPRGQGLKGHVVFFDSSTHSVKNQLFGEEFGSYFGASLLVIRHEDGGDDILVGAPTAAGNSWDEGAVYYYKNKNDGTFYPPIKLSTKMSLSRFGTVMASLGDIDLDSFTDCAVSAPYEENTGAVYIYFGGKDGFVNDRFHRISPSDFFVGPVKGFGMGISKGNDIDRNKHNDIAIGAYQSGQVFYFTTNQIFDVTKNITSNMTTLFTSTTSFSVTYCIEFRFRNGDLNTKRNIFTLLILDDDRVLNERNISGVITLQPNEAKCNIHTVHLKEDHLNIEPFVVRYGHNGSSNDNLTYDVLTVPVSYECGNDNICQTQLSLSSPRIALTKIVIGVNNELQVNVTVNNDGESAYQAKIIVEVPPEISLINLRECDFVNGSYVCLVAQLLRGPVKKMFLFDLANLQPYRADLPIKFQVVSIGQDDDLSDNRLDVHVPVTLQNNPYIDSRSTPDSVFLNTTGSVLTLKHVFLVGNQGPSPLYINLTVFAPVVENNGNDTLKIKSIEGYVNGVETECKYLTTKVPNLTPINKKQQVVNNTKIISCLESDNCTTIQCIAGFFSKSNENAIFDLRLALDLDSLVKLNESANKFLIMSTAQFTNGTHEFATTASTLIYRMDSSYDVPLWIYLISIFAGLALLLILVFSLYKCNFFERKYKDKLVNEQLVSETSGQEEEEQLHEDMIDT